MIREVEEKDYPMIQQIALECFDKNIAIIKNLMIARFLMKRFYKANSINKRLKNKNKIFVFEEAGNIKGFFEFQDGGYIVNVFISPSCQHQGVGSQLMDYVIQYYQENLPDVKMLTLDAVKEAIPFYEKFGFKFLNRSKTQFGCDFYPMERIMS